MRIPLPSCGSRRGRTDVEELRRRPTAPSALERGVMPLAQLGVAECQRRCDRMYPGDRAAQIACYNAYCTP